MDVDTDPGLVPFIEASKEKGATDSFVVELLRAAGWPERRIYAAFLAHYTKVTGMPVPMRGNRFEYASDGFLYLLAFISLGCWATGAGHLLYVLIGEWFPNALDEPYVVHSFRENVSLELATIIVAYPIFVVVSGFINRQLRNKPESADSGVRKWLTYIALVIAAVVLLTDAIFFLQSFLHGDLTVRFVLDTLVLFVIVGCIFAYYLGTLRGEPISVARNRGFLAGSVALVAGTLVCGFTNLGGPERQHVISLDEHRVSDLASIKRWITSDYRLRHEIPAKLPPTMTLRDPQTGLPYGYRRVDADHYELCADFATISQPQTPTSEFAHAAQRSCFTLAADDPAQY